MKDDDKKYFFDESEELEEEDVEEYLEDETSFDGEDDVSGGVSSFDGTQEQYNYQEYANQKRQNQYAKNSDKENSGEETANNQNNLNNRSNNAEFENKIKNGKAKEYDGTASSDSMSDIGNGPKKGKIKEHDGTASSNSMSDIGSKKISKKSESSLDTSKSELESKSGLNPKETLKNNLKEKAKDKVSEKSETAGKAIDVADKTVGTVKKLKILAALLSNPVFWYVVLAILVVLLFILLIAAIAGAGGSNSGGSYGSDGYGSQSYYSACDSINIKTTSQSRSEFVDALNNYYTGNSSVSKAFRDNAGNIYDIATSNNINPEMVIVRAMREGYDPGGSTNNYWGMGCTNSGGGADCHRYSSFSEGVLAYVKNISQYDSVSSMMLKYSYIGRYWYSSKISGASGKGGCYYYPHIKQFMASERSQEVATVCNYNAANNTLSDNGCLSVSGGSNCTATNSDDQLAYSKWQVYKMALERKTVFGIDPDSCTNNGTDTTTLPDSSGIIYAQADKRWNTIRLGKSSTTMGRSGCAVTSIAIGISTSGAEIYMDNFDAGSFVKKLNAGNCFTAEGNIYWGCNAIYQVANIKYQGQVSFSGMTNTNRIAKIQSYDLNQYFVLINFKNSAHPRGHYVVYSSVSNDEFVVKDPAGGKISTVPIKDVNKIVIYKYERGN